MSSGDGLCGCEDCSECEFGMESEREGGGGFGRAKSKGSESVPLKSDFVKSGERILGSWLEATELKRELCFIKF